MNRVLFLILNFFLIHLYCHGQDCPLKNEVKTPKVSIITSIYKGESFIKGFLEDIVQISNFDNCELLLINANSPENEEQYIKPYLEKYSNISYEKLKADPGVYAVWNLGIKKARAEYLTNANLDDRRNFDFLVKQIEILDEHPEIDLVYSDYILTETPNETFQQNTAKLKVVVPEFSPKTIHICLGGPQPLWRKSMHDRYGLFCEDFRTSGDLEMWNRAVCKGSQFKHIEGLSGLYYQNPQGLSTNSNTKKEEENLCIASAYGYFWRDLENSHPKLLLKIQTRNNPENFLKALRLYYKNLSGFVNYHILISLDASDPSMNSLEMIEKLRTYPNLSIHFGKWEAEQQIINRDLNFFPDADVILIGKDNVDVVDPGFDLVVTQTMSSQFPDYDGVLFFSDNNHQPLKQYPVIGKNYYQQNIGVYPKSDQPRLEQKKPQSISEITEKSENVKVIDKVLFSNK